VLIFNGHLWHSGTRNETGLRRRVLQCSFVARDEPRLAAEEESVPERLSPAARYLLGV
jgi:ectoine hydroxylase-related dioxygenase (phytanoyl-CoA dioxygenase family)